MIFNHSFRLRFDVQLEISFRHNVLRLPEHQSPSKTQPHRSPKSKTYWPHPSATSPGQAGRWPPAPSDFLAWEQRVATYHEHQSVGPQSHLCSGKRESSHKPVSKETTGHTELNLILSFAYSTAMVFVALMTAALDALYQVKFGRGRSPAVEAMVTKVPPLPFFCR